LAMDTTTVSVDLSGYLDSIIQIKAIDIPSSNNCSSYFLVVDNNPPVLSCPWDTVACTTPLDPINIKPVSITDNCQSGATFIYTDVVMAPDCGYPDPALVGVVVRTYEFTYPNDSTYSCQQFIFIQRANNTDVVFPANTTVDCSSGFADPAVTGWPEINGQPIVPGGPCNIVVDSNDVGILPGCGGNPILLREWVVFNTCTNMVSVDTQQILFEDITPPTMICPGSLSYPTAPGQCDTTITLPIPTVIEDCSGYYITVSTPGAGAGLTLFDIPKGVYTTTYTATDSCGNFSTCQTQLSIVDDETPAAVCDGYKTLTLPSITGTATLPAAIFDAGSHDNCSLVGFSVSRDGNPFGPTVDFDCTDVGDSVMVILHVYELVNPSSFTDCMNWVVVQDKTAPIFTNCPDPVTIDCGTDYSDLSVFGLPALIDNCGYTLTGDSSITINNCGVGTIERNWTAVDPSGNSSSCSQIITVDNLTPYDGSTIVWPADTTFFDLCVLPGAFDPDSLPPGYNYPAATTTTCEMLAVNYSDQIFYFSFPSCYKIVRTWSILDWCQYDPANPSAGVWSHQQVIATMDTQAPQVTFVPADTTVGVNLTCTFGVVDIPPVTAADCSPDITITNDSPYANSNGANASGNYPPGVHNVTFTIKDGCGNQTTASMQITVSDLKMPTPYCNSGVVGELGNVGGQIMVTMDAWKFNNASSDNCTDTVDLLFNIRLAGDTMPPVPSLDFTCADEGMHMVEFWVTDEAGNSDYCITDLIIQDNMGWCPDTLVTGSAVIGGEISTEMGDMMPEVTVEIANAGLMDYTSGGGVYEFNDLAPNASYEVTPLKNTDPLNGVTTFDLVLMSRHVLAIAPLTSPYKIIAADINHNGAVTTADIVELRKLILNIYDEFPQNNSWRFVDAGYTFPDPEHPFTPPFPEVKTITSLTQDITDADFIGVKIGDLNGSAAADFGGHGTGNRSMEGEMTLWMPDRRVQAGEEVTVPIFTTENQDLLTLQFTLEFETDDLELQGIEKGALTGNMDESFGFTRADEGILTAGWFDLNPVQVEQNSALFSLSFTARSSGQLSDFIRLSSKYTEAMAYNAEEVPLN
ncbi:MAG: HYR domain-containing protein, partial [Saprospiraceae bacterium]